MPTRIYIDNFLSKLKIDLNNRHGQIKRQTDKYPSGHYVVPQFKQRMKKFQASFKITISSG